MCKGVHQCVLAAIVTLLDLAVLVHCAPIICVAWGTNRLLMTTPFIGTFVWANSLANLLSAAHHSLSVATRSELPALGADELPPVAEGGEANV